ncbi:hypothetical protein ISN44_As01g042560 [Arabidopsis suecica]|uniref:Uncharacterized protein n=1 Tax=Arabidopsis suecica TaxID=45249 RepID=A0A8T2HCJ1_ARASU|nr:hypothetical protein ISN44_As01g042560 [Arabidopsis suecica]
MALPPYDPNFTLAFSYGRRDNVFENDPEHDESASAAIDCLTFALKKGGIPRAEDWPPLGSESKTPSSYEPALVSMKGEVIEPKDMDEVRELLVHQSAVGAKLHVFTPHIELQQDAIYCASSGEYARYVGLRDGIVVGTEKIQGKSMAIVKVWYKKKFVVVKVALSRMFYLAGVGPSVLLVDFCVPRLSID